jgi:flagellar protein FliT
MDSAEKLYRCTRRLLDHLQKGLPKTDRETYIEMIEKLLDERQQLIAQLPESFNGQETVIGEKIIRDDHLIQKMLRSMFDEIKEDVHHLQRRKQMRNRYVHPYSNGEADGMFLDKRK